MYIKGPGTSFADMDIDCDGEQNGPGNDGRCASSPDTQAATSFQSTIQGYNKGINDLNANVHPYVVFGNEGSKHGWKTFDPREYGVEPLSIMAVVCGSKLVRHSLPSLWHQHSNHEPQIYGVWGDTNGDDDAKPLVGEASLALATACFGTSMTGNNGHDEPDVLYLAFPGSDAVPGANGANWGAVSWKAFEASIEGLGNKLIQRIGNSTGDGSSIDPAPSLRCE
jgi:hypothetical protein